MSSSRISRQMRIFTVLAVFLVLGACSDTHICPRNEYVELTGEFENGFQTVMVLSCCEGYRQTQDGCIPVCDEGCSNGVCTEPNNCTCNEGYKPSDDNPDKCIPDCDHCEEGHCYAPQKCNKCNSGFGLNATHFCLPFCPADCTYLGCDNTFDCIRCEEGYKRVGDVCKPVYDAKCENGIYVAPNDCKCLESFKKDASGKCSPVCDSFLNETCVEYCLPEYWNNETGNNSWLIAKISCCSTLSTSCPQETELPITGRCVGNDIDGVTWQPLPPEGVTCFRNDHIVEVTWNLIDIHKTKLDQKSPEKAAKEVHLIIDKNLRELIPADLFHLSKIMKTLSKEIRTLKQMMAAEKFVNIYDKLMDVNTNTMQKSIELNASNVLLESFENFVDDTAIEADCLWANQSVVDKGCCAKILSKLLIVVIDPSVSNISGIALYNEGNANDKVFRNFSIRYLHSNQSVDELLNDTSIQLATFFPEKLLNSLDFDFDFDSRENVTTAEERPPLRIVLKVYVNDRFFQADNTSDRVASYIVSVSIPGYSHVLPEPLPIIMRSNYNDQSSNSTELDTSECGYWNYKSWAKDGVSLLNRSEADPNLVLCVCDHLTPFGYLVQGGYPDLKIEKVHNDALNLITTIGCSLSLLGVAGIYVTALMFYEWRKTASARVILQLSTAIAIQMILFCFVNTKSITEHLLQNKIFSSCIILGAALHYSVLVLFCWMIIIAYLQYKRYVIILGHARPTNFFLKSIIVGWGLPLVPVVLVVLIDRDSYIPTGGTSGAADICYPTGNSLVFGVILPICLVIITNISIYILILSSILRPPKIAVRQDDVKLAISQLRVSVSLFFLLGITWIFGILSVFQPEIIFSYIFCITATLQGFVLFINFIVLNPITRKLWIRALKPAKSG